MAVWLGYKVKALGEAAISIPEVEDIAASGGVGRSADGCAMTNTSVGSDCRPTIALEGDGIGLAIVVESQHQRALGISTISSATGGMISGLMLVFIAPTLASMALKFSAPETFALAFFGISIISSISGKSLVKGLISGLLGLILALVGMDNISGFTRFTFGSIFLMNGLSFIPVLVGLFAMSQCLLSIEDLFTSNSVDTTNIKRAKISMKDFLKILPTMIRSGITGTFIDHPDGGDQALSRTTGKRSPNIAGSRHRIPKIAAPRLHNGTRWC